MNHYENIQIIAFDADDTLWLNEPIFTHTEEQFKNLLRSYIDIVGLDQKLYETESKNLRIFGYGVKGFTLSMIETAVELTNGKISGKDIQHIIELGKAMLDHPIELLDGVEETVKALSGQYTLMIITKGELFHQESKIARSGLAAYFQHIEILSEKSKATYQKLLDQYQFNPETFLMVGNSLKSDIIPICECQAHAIHIPFHTTWVHEVVEDHRLNGYEYQEIDNLRQLIPLLGKQEKRAAAEEEIDCGPFRLRSLRINDAPIFAKQANNLKIANMVQDRFPHPYTEKAAEQFITNLSQSNDQKVFGIEVDGQVAGAIGLKFQPDVYRFSVEMGYWLGEAYWGRGIMSKAIETVTDYALQKMNMNRVFARVYENNPGSMKALEKAGFEKEGIAKKAVVKNGEVLDLYVFGKWG